MAFDAAHQDAQEGHVPRDQAESSSMEPEDALRKGEHHVVLSVTSAQLDFARFWGVTMHGLWIGTHPTGQWRTLLQMKGQPSVDVTSRSMSADERGQRCFIFFVHHKKEHVFRWFFGPLMLVSIRHFRQAMTETSKITEKDDVIQVLARKRWADSRRVGDSMGGWHEHASKYATSVLVPHEIWLALLKYVDVHEV